MRNGNATRSLKLQPLSGLLVQTPAMLPARPFVAHRRQDLRRSEDVQLACQHEDIAMVDYETVNKPVRDNEHQPDDDMYGSEADKDDDMNVDTSNKARHRGTGKV